MDQLPNSFSLAFLHHFCVLGFMYLPVSNHRRLRRRSTKTLNLSARRLRYLYKREWLCKWALLWVCNPLSIIRRPKYLWVQLIISDPSPTQIWKLLYLYFYFYFFNDHASWSSVIFLLSLGRYPKFKFSLPDDWKKKKKKIFYRFIAGVRDTNVRDLCSNYSNNVICIISIHYAYVK